MTYHTLLKDTKNLRRVMVKILILYKYSFFNYMKMCNACEPPDAYIWKVKDEKTASYHFEKKEAIKLPAEVNDDKILEIYFEKNLENFLLDENNKLKMHRDNFNFISREIFFDRPSCKNSFTKFSKSDTLLYRKKQQRLYMRKKELIQIMNLYIPDF